jgi:hypothetical protein
LDGRGFHTAAEFLSECLFHKIWLIFLPAHTSHILQPCDLDFLSNTKPGYRLKLAIACTFMEESFPGKREFLEAYSRNGEFTGTSKHIKAGWKAARIYPRDRNKPLSSRYVRRAGNSPYIPISPLISVRETPDFDGLLSPTSVKTPKTFWNFVIAIKELRGIDPVINNPITRLLFRKFGKAFDEKIAETFVPKAREVALQHVLERTKPKKRKGVLPAPNEDFVRMADVMKVRCTMLGAVGPNSDDDGNDEVEFEIKVGDEIQDCIMVKMTDSLSEGSINEWVIVVSENHSAAVRWKDWGCKAMLWKS